MGLTEFHKLFFYVCCWGSVQVNQELDAGPHGSKQFTMRSAFWELKPYRPSSTRIDLHCNPCHSWWIPRVWYSGEKSFGNVQNYYMDFDSVLVFVLTRINLQCKTALTLVIYCIVLHAMGCEKFLHLGRYWLIGVEKDLKWFLNGLRCTKMLNITKIRRNWHVTMRVFAGGTGRYGFNSVWNPVRNL
jgi:hypothetical protein